MFQKQALPFATDAELLAPPERLQACWLLSSMSLATLPAGHATVSVSAILTRTYSSRGTRTSLADIERADGITLDGSCVTYARCMCQCGMSSLACPARLANALARAMAYFVARARARTE